MYRTRFGIFASVMLALFSTCAARANAGDLPEPVTYRIELLGREPVNEWARVASVLVDGGLAAIQALQLKEPRDNPCNAVLQALRFRTLNLACSEAVEKIIHKLNPQLTTSAHLGAIVRYPDLPIEAFTWHLTFDKSLENEASLYKYVTSAWKQFQIDEQTKGSKTQTQFRGFRTRVSVIPTEENVKILRSLPRFNATLGRYEVRVIRVDDRPIATSGYSASGPSGWYKACRQGEGALPKPSYGTLLELSSQPDCLTNCVQRDNCPEIILIDKTVKRHPDILRALGQPESSPLAETCPDIGWSDEHHGTHLAGIMVSAVQSTSFPGLAPTASLESQSDKMQADEFAQSIRDRGFGYTRNVVFVFASRFTHVGADINAPLPEPNRRYETPFYVADIINQDRFWVVAAGNDRVGRHIADNSRLSPMNLGDLRNVLVVTACEDCSTDNAVLSSWANYSRHQLVNVAAPGGTPTDPIPATATETQYSSTYGTSQATALVGGLAAAMLSCYPDTYSNSTRLKLRILATVRPPLHQDIKDKISAGFVNAEMALRDPNVHWITLMNGEKPKKAKELYWCREHISMRSPESRTLLEDGTFSAKMVRQIVRHESPTVILSWTIVRELEEGKQAIGKIKTTGPGRLVDEGPLLRVRYLDGTLSAPLTIDQIHNLLVGFGSKSNLVVGKEKCS